ncbi:hypothetical protein P171DRAFT_286335 [Karstenula rhodostoma CBS 690.94]|uniref:Uncharacterized protein n=1 Tax=Karstenula rhodostoma CBS 690.94 TaxID=1392251 RepID=A0A9P4UC76_9PLEO|nr:hypothetical protein P171DRAFT_286335 [Karstenula rhodostoma CBS 690.94]
MTPEEYNRAKRESKRYDHYFDSNMDRIYFAEPLRNKNGKIAARQPEIPKANTPYWKAQCSFRGLKTSGTIEDLQARLRTRNKSKDAEIEKKSTEASTLVHQEDRRRAAAQAEAWWIDPSRTFREHLEKDSHRALKDNLDKGGSLSRSYELIPMSYLFDLQKPALDLGLSWQRVHAPESYREPNSYRDVTVQIVGQEKAVNKKAKEISAEKQKEVREMEKKRLVAEKAQKAADKAKKQAVLTEAKKMDDWDLTGGWEVECDDLADYSSEQSSKLTMNVWCDHFDPTNPRGANTPLGDAYDNEEDDEFDQDESGETDYDDYSDMETDGEEEDEEDTYARTKSTAKPTATARSKASQPTVSLPCFGATFSFGVVSGVMRLYPVQTPRKKSNANFKVKNNKTFEFIWRGRETGESQIQIGSDKNAYEITFGNHGTTFTGKFSCNYVGKVTIKGTKMSHGHGQKGSSMSRWEQLSERAHDQESRSRWGKWSW